MEIAHGRIVWQILLSFASLICFVTALRWFRLNYAMYKSGEARALLVPLQPFMMTDLLTNIRRIFGRDQIPSDLEERMENMRFESIISSNYVKAFALLVFSFIAGVLAFRGPG